MLPLKDNIGKLLGWLIVGACTVINIMLFENAIELPTLSGAGAAQADLGLYFILRGVSVIFVFVSVVVVSVSLLVRNRTRGLSGALRYNYGISIMAIVNGLIPLLILYWLVSVWKH